MADDADAGRAAGREEVDGGDGVGDVRRELRRAGLAVLELRDGDAGPPEAVVEAGRVRAADEGAARAALDAAEG